MSPFSRLLTLIALLTGIAVIAAGLAVLTGTIISEEVTADDGRSETVVLEPSSAHAGIVDGELVVEFQRVNKEATSTFDRVFTITTQEGQTIRLDVDVDGVEFYREDTGDSIASDARLDLEKDETVPVGITVDTANFDPKAGTFTVYVESEPAEPTYAVGSYVFTGRLFALLAVQIAIGLLVTSWFIRRRDIWPTLP